MNKVELLNETKNYLLDKGWAQGSFEDTDGRVCILGALNRVCYNDKLREQVYRDMVNTVSWNTVSGWNDQDERTFNDVIDLLDEMVLKAKEEANG